MARKSCGDTPANDFLNPYKNHGEPPQPLDHTCKIVSKALHSIKHSSPQSTSKHEKKQDTIMTKGILWVSSRITQPNNLSAQKFCKWYEDVRHIHTHIPPEKFNS